MSKTEMSHIEEKLVPIKAQKADFECLVTRHDPTYTDQVASIEIVKEFIIKHKLIVYGGSAIDYALRLHGDKIYPDDMLAVPDLDFYSPDNVQHAYQLADQLHDNGFLEARAINATHMMTMRVDVRDNHWIADISYVPPAIFAKLPFIEYNGIRCIHPHFQRLDVHSALSFPYDSAPREVIFHRWAKDIKRFNILNKYYPLPAVGQTAPLKSLSVSAKKYVLTGFAAYGAILRFYNEHLEGQTDKAADKTTEKTKLFPAKFTCEIQTFKGEINHIFHLDTLSAVELVHMDIDKCAEELELLNSGESVNKYYPYFNLVPKRIEGVSSKSKIPYTLYSTSKKLVAYNSITIDGVQIRITNVQYLLKHFLAWYQIHKNKNELTFANTMLACYLSLLQMIANGWQIIPKTGSNPLALSQSTYGGENIESSHEVMLSRLYAARDKAESPYLPQGYNAAKAKAAGRTPPEFDYSRSKYFSVDGELIM